MYRESNFLRMLGRRPHARAEIRGNAQHANLHGWVRFYQTEYGVLTVAEISGLPKSEERCQSRVFGFHIHEGSSCTGNAGDVFADVGTHYNPYGCPHPYHVGDLPPLFGSEGYAFSAFLSNRFTVADILGRTVIVHSQPDDFTTQPSGNSGEKIACGEIRA